MRGVALALSLALLTACAPKDDAPAADDAAVQAPAAPTIADFAGNYAVTAIIGTDTVPSTMMLTADGAGSTMSLPGRPDVPITVSMSGDSLVTQSAEYESVLQAGTMVTVRTAAVRGADGGMTGNMVATYKAPGGDTVANGSITASRTP
jgi:hypothetical protein